jgi:hypothetical protein
MFAGKEAEAGGGEAGAPIGGIGEELGAEVVGFLNDPRAARAAPTTAGGRALEKR